jgi:hypothetical protein
MIKFDITYLQPYLSFVLVNHENEFEIIISYFLRVIQINKLHFFDRFWRGHSKNTLRFFDRFQTTQCQLVTLVHRGHSNNT